MRGLLTLVALSGIGLHTASAVAEPLLDPIPATIEYGDKQIKLTNIADGMVAPLHATAPPGDTGRLFVADQVGIIHAIDLASGVRTEFLDISARTLVNIGGYDERGLLGLAFHPDYATNGYFYTYTSEETDGDADFPWEGGFTFGPHQSVITEWRVDNPLNPAELPDPAYERDIMRIDQPTGFHNAGALTFDLKGFMLIALGNGGPLNSGQDNTSVLGSILRIVPNANYAPYGSHLPSANGQYLVPDTNPFLLDAGAIDEIFAHGFRNPFRVTVDRAFGDIYAGDVGNNDIEEVDLVVAGNNYGFAIKEGSFCFVGQGGQPDGSPGVEDPSECVAESAGLTDPLAEYDHDEGIAVIGGYMYRGKGNADLRNMYVFGDYNGRLFYLDGLTIRELRLFSPDTIGGLLLGMGEDASGELYALVNNTGRTGGSSGRVLRIDALSPMDSAVNGWATLMKELYAAQGIGPAGVAKIDQMAADRLAASESGDPDAIYVARRQMHSFISAVNWGRNRWGNPVVTDEQADTLIAAAKQILFVLPNLLFSGLHTMQSGGVERSYYLRLPSDYNTNQADKPLIVGFHGSFGSHQSWVGPNRYTFKDVVGDDAIMIFPDALPLGGGGINWNFEYDFEFFADLIRKLNRRGLTYDHKKLFVTGHSSGAGMANEVGCRFGDIVRAIAISSGSLISNQCIGSVAVIQSQGEADLAVPLNIGAVAHNFWVLYNGWDIDMSVPGVTPPCIDHSLLPLGSEKYPVQWCLHPGGHAWPAFASNAFWDFFSGLPDAEPTPEAPPGGGNDRVLAAADTTISFTLNYPEGMGTITGGAITLYPPTYCAGLFAAPSVFLNAAWPPGDAAPGSTVTYENVPVTYFSFGPFVTPADYQLQISIYIQGGSQPIPTPGVDLIALEPINIPDTTTPLILSEPLDVEFVPPFIGTCPAATAVPQTIGGRSSAAMPSETAVGTR
ncbi:MAG: hypothetical protein CL799_11535 [Chromatiales bacterium]|jgi:glucose/arabinose dehydrogenase/predicted esterase|nr:hypothetical protein [Chromatiales bacterium]